MHLVRTLLHRWPQHECKTVVVWVAQPELHVGSQALLELFHRIPPFLSVPQSREGLKQTRKTLFDQALEQFFLVLEVQIDAPRRVFDLFSQLTHGELLVTLVHEDLTRGVQAYSA